MTPTTLEEALALLDDIQPGCWRPWQVGRVAVHVRHHLGGGWQVATVKQASGDQTEAGGRTREEAARVLLSIARRQRVAWGPASDCGLLAAAGGWR